MQELSFKTEIKDVELSGLSDFLGVPDCDIEDNGPIAYVEWYIAPDVRDYGISDITIVVKRITCVIEWDAYIKDFSQVELEQLKKMGGVEMNNKRIQGSLTIDSTLPLTSGTEQKTFKVTDEDFSINPSGSIIPGKVEIDFYKFLIDVR